MEQLGILPLAIIGGESITKTIMVNLHSSDDGWELKYVFSDTPVTQIICTAADNGAFTLTVPGANTIPWPSGVIRYVAYATKAVIIEAVDAGAIDVTASPLAPPSWAAAALTAVEATLAGTATSDQASMSIDGMNLSRRSPEQLITLRNWLRAEARLAGANRPRRVIRSTFGGPFGRVYPLLPPVRMS